MLKAALQASEIWTRKSNLQLFSLIFVKNRKKLGNPKSVKHDRSNKSICKSSFVFQNIFSKKDFSCNATYLAICLRCFTWLEPGISDQLRVWKQALYKKHKTRKYKTYPCLYSSGWGAERRGWLRYRTPSRTWSIPARRMRGIIYKLGVWISTYVQ